MSSFNVGYFFRLTCRKASLLILKAHLATFLLNAFLNPKVGTISIMREGVRKVVYAREGLEFAAP